MQRSPKLRFRQAAEAPSKGAVAEPNQNAIPFATSRSRQRKKQARPTREQKSEETRRALFEAAARVVGKYGYAGASVSRITSKAKLAQGTFYNYFDSRQDLLDQLLPAMGDVMLDYLRTHMDPKATGWRREADRLQAYLDFLVQNPWFHRLVNEAETLAPKAHKIYFEKVSKGYAAGLLRSIGRGEITRFREADIEPLTYMLMAIRTYLAQRYAHSNGKVQEVDSRVIDIYGRLARHGLFG